MDPGFRRDDAPVRSSRRKPGSSAPTMARISAVRVRVGVGHSLEAEGNCVAERRGGEQLEAN